MIQKKREETKDYINKNKNSNSKPLVVLHTVLENGNSSHDVFDEATRRPDLINDRSEHI